MERRGRGVTLGKSLFPEWRYSIAGDVSTVPGGVIVAEGWESSHALARWFEANKGKTVPCRFSDGTVLAVCARGVSVHESGHWSEAVMEVETRAS